MASSGKPTVGCDVCHAAAAYQCDRCRQTRYCGTACQTRHWRSEHGRHCFAPVQWPPSVCSSRFAQHGPALFSVLQACSSTGVGAPVGQEVEAPAVSAILATVRAVLDRAEQFLRASGTAHTLAFLDAEYGEFAREELARHDTSGEAFDLGALLERLEALDVGEAPGGVAVLCALQELVGGVLRYASRLFAFGAPLAGALRALWERLGGQAVLDALLDTLARCARHVGQLGAATWALLRLLWTRSAALVRALVERARAALDWAGRATATLCASLYRGAGDADVRQTVRQLFLYVMAIGRAALQIGVEYGREARETYDAYQDRVADAARVLLAHVTTLADAALQALFAPVRGSAWFAAVLDTAFFAGARLRRVATVLLHLLGVFAAGALAQSPQFILLNAIVTWLLPHASVAVVSLAGHVRTWAARASVDVNESARQFLLRGRIALHTRDELGAFDAVLAWRQRRRETAAVARMAAVKRRFLEGQLSVVPRGRRAQRTRASRLKWLARNYGARLWRVAGYLARVQAAAPDEARVAAVVAEMAADPEVDLYFRATTGHSLAAHGEAQAAAALEMTHEVDQWLVERFLEQHPAAAPAVGAPLSVASPAGAAAALVGENGDGDNDDGTEDEDEEITHEQALAIITRTQAEQRLRRYDAGRLETLRSAGELEEFYTHLSRHVDLDARVPDLTEADRVFLRRQLAARRDAVKALLDFLRDPSAVTEIQQALREKARLERGTAVVFALLAAAVAALAYNAYYEWHDDRRAELDAVLATKHAAYDVAAVLPATYGEQRRAAVANAARSMMQSRGNVTLGHGPLARPLFRDEMIVDFEAPAADILARRSAAVGELFDAWRGELDAVVGAAASQDDAVNLVRQTHASASAVLFGGADPSLLPSMQEASDPRGPLRRTLDWLFGAGEPDEAEARRATATHEVALRGALAAGDARAAAHFFRRWLADASEALQALRLREVESFTVTWYTLRDADLRSALDAVERGFNGLLSLVAPGAGLQRMLQLQLSTSFARVALFAAPYLFVFLALLVLFNWLLSLYVRRSLKDAAVSFLKSFGLFGGVAAFAIGAIVQTFNAIRPTSAVELAAGLFMTHAPLLGIAGGAASAAASALSVSLARDLPALAGRPEDLAFVTVEVSARLRALAARLGTTDELLVAHMQRLAAEQEALRLPAAIV